MTEILVETSDKSYPIFIDSQPIENLKKQVFEHTKANKILVVISKKVDRLYGKKLRFKNSVKFVLKDGEKEKNLKNYQKILNFALKNKLERKDAIIAIGGGVVGDIAGFVASTYLRGIDFIQIPTTLLACVDSSVGGKTAVNTDFGKNLVGTFYQPKAVFCNLNFLKTLDERQFKTGLAEIVKYAFIQANCPLEMDFSFFDFLQGNAEKLLARDEEVLAQIIKICLELKSAVVKHDEKEQGLRKILNFGHTYAHALEKITNYKKYTHGEAVAVGIIFALKLAYEKELITKKYKDESIKLVEKYNLAIEAPIFKPEKILEAMKSDKKVKNGQINFVLPTEKLTVECFNIEPKDILKAL